MHNPAYRQRSFCKALGRFLVSRVFLGKTRHMCLMAAALWFVSIVDSLQLLVSFMHSTEDAVPLKCCFFLCCCWQFLSWRMLQVRVNYNMYRKKVLFWALHERQVCLFPYRRPQSQRRPYLTYWAGKQKRCKFINKQTSNSPPCEPYADICHLNGPGLQLGLPMIDITKTFKHLQT